MEFYDYYFESTSHNTMIPICHFYHPILSRKFFKDFKGKPKGINSNYIKLIMKSDLFVKDMRAYIEEDFYFDYLKEIEAKIEKLIGAWETKLRQRAQNSFNIA